MSGGFHRLVVAAAMLGVCAATYPSVVLAKGPALGRSVPQQHAIQIRPGHRVVWSRLPNGTSGDHPPRSRSALRPVAGVPPPASAAARATTNLELPRTPNGGASAAVFGQTPEVLARIAGTTRSQQMQQLGMDQASEPPDTQIAVGPDSIIELTNSAFAVWSKTGTLLSERDLNVFFGTPAGYWFGDPRVLYDPATGRWFAAGLAVNTSNASQAYLAVSLGSDPLGAWYVNSTAVSASLFDQPKIGVTNDKVVLSWNEYASAARFVGQRTQVIQKSDLLAGGTLNVIVFSLDSTRFNLVPVAVSPLTTAYLLYNGNTLRGSIYAGGYIGVVAISGTPLAGNVVWGETDPSIGATDIPPNARQPQAAPDLDTRDDRFLSAAQMGGVISVMGNDGCVPIGDTSLRSCMRFIQVSTSATATVLANVRYGSLGTDLFYPAVAIDSMGSLFSVFSASSSSLFAGLYAGVQPAGTAALTMVALQSGSGAYNYAPCGYSNRWGDYSAAVLDPTDSADVWVAGEYSATATDSCNWGTGFGRLTLAAPTVSAVSPMSGPAVGGTPVMLTGSDFVQGATTVMFGTVSSTFVSVQSPNALTAVAPPEPAGTVSVTALTADGTSAPTANDRFTFTDTTPPALQSMTVAPTSVSAGESVVVGLHVSDPDGTVALVNVRYSSPSAPLGTAASASLSLVSGNGVDGLWQATIGVPSNSESGAWTVYEVVARDVVGNTTAVFAPSTPTLSGSFVVTRMTRLVGQTVALPRGDAPPPAVGSSKPSSTATNEPPRTSVPQVVGGLALSPAAPISLGLDGRSIRGVMDRVALHAVVPT